MGACIFSRPLLPREQKKAVSRQKKQDHEARLIDIALAGTDSGGGPAVSGCEDRRMNDVSRQEREMQLATDWINSHMDDAHHTFRFCASAVPPAPAPVRDLILADGHVTDHMRYVLVVLQRLLRPLRRNDKVYLCAFPERASAVGALIQISAEQRGDETNLCALRAFRACHHARSCSRKDSREAVSAVRNVAAALRSYVDYICITRDRRPGERSCSYP